MKRHLCGAVVAIMLLGISPACAEELWVPHLRGIDEGLVAGALPPKGLYFINNTYFASWKLYDGNGKPTGTKLDALVDIPILLWNPGIKVLGADYALGIAQPFDYSSMDNTSGSAHTGTYNTVLIPAMLSWALPNNFHIKTGLSVYVDDASSASGTRAPSAGVGSGNGFWTLEPELGISWLKDGWNLSADIRYDYNFKNETTDYNSGNMLSVEYTVAKTFGKWTVGAGAAHQHQIQHDRGPSAGGTRFSYTAGPLVEYNFGSVSLTATLNFDITTHHDFGGDFLNVRLVVPLD
ncbi:MAG: transporter [Alphaproteobacteria bacterium]|nr:transporter [Alphaproteobacteria bacterium]